MSRTDVAIDARRTSRHSAGMLAYTDELVHRLPRLARDLRVRPLAVGTTTFGVREQVVLPLVLARLRPRLTHFPTVYAPLVRPRRYVVTVHDLNHLQMPELFSAGVAAYYRVAGKPLLRGAERLIVGDQKTVAECERLLGVPPERCRVVPLGYDEALLAPDDDAPPPPRPFVFYAGNHRAHKDLPTLYAAWAALPDDLDVDLVVTGADEPEARARWTRARGALRFTGDIDRTAVRRLYRTALVYVQPSLVEGFGLPVLEAAVLGTPVVGTVQAVPTIAAPYVRTIGVRDVAALRAEITAIARDSRAARQRAAQGVGVLRAYTWDRFATGVAEVYREVLDVADPS